MMELTQEQIRSFLAVTEEKSFSLAAEKIYRTQSAVSIQISRLEEQLETRLFNRTTKQLNLTEAGEVLYRYLKRVESTLEEAEAELGDLRRVKKGRLVLSTSDTTACYHLPPILQGFREIYPEVDILVRNAPSPRTRQMVLNNEVDLGIVTLDRDTGELTSVPLFPRKDVMICPPEHPLAGRGELFLKDMETQPFILLDDKCSTRQILDRLLISSRVSLKIAMELSSVEVIKRFVRINAGISVIPEAAIRDEISAGLLSSVKIKDYAAVKPVYLGMIYRKNRYLSAVSREFLEYISGEKQRPGYQL